MNGKIKSILLNVLLPILAAACMFLFWYIAARMEDNALILPYPKEVLTRFFILWQEKSFFKSLFSTLERTLLCFALSFVFALILAVLTRLLPPLSKFFAPVVSVLRSAPTVAVILIFYAFMQAKKMAIVVGFLIGFPILYSSFSSLLFGVDNDLITMAKVYKVNVLRRIIHIFIPSILPGMLDSSRSTLSLTLKVVVAAEILTLVPSSLGGKIQSAYSSFEISYLLSWTLLAIVLSYALELVVAALKLILVRWKK